ncbi:MAG TPA: hypothetical protein VM238_07140 [Phycisphaerae bacterium]|nr:hypothetical protein [Phycisphaerae bacterium]
MSSESSDGNAHRGAERRASSEGATCGRGGKAFTLRSDDRAVTRRIDFESKKHSETPFQEGPPVSVIIDGKPSVYKFTEVQLQGVVLAVLGSGWRKRRDVIRSAARCLGYKRVTKSIRESLDWAIDDLIVENRIVGEGNWIRKAGGERANEARPPETEPARRPTVQDLDRHQLRAALLEVVGTDWIERDDAIRAAARSLGFQRCGKHIHKAFASAINGLLRQKRLESTGSMVRRT